MRLENWNPNKFDQDFEDVVIERLVAAGEVVAAKARSKCHAGTISRPSYKKKAGRNWTSRDPGRLKKSIRVVRKKTKSGKAFTRKRNIRVYAGHFLAYYAGWVEFGTSRTKAQQFLRPALFSSISEINSIVGAR